MMCSTEQKTEKLIKLSKKDLMIMLEPYSDNSLICIGLQMQQGYVGFFDLEHDTEYKDKCEFVLNSDCFNKWYKKDIAELQEKIIKQQLTINNLNENNKHLQEKIKELKSILADEKRLNNGYSNYFDRCTDCIHFKSYYFDEYDSDCWCSIFDKLKENYCKKFKYKGEYQR